MINFGERLAYWYLRLNGFLLLEDFVLHRQDGKGTSDADLLGIRLRHSAEAINDVPLTLHRAIQELVGQGTDQQNAAVVVQVKTGAERSARHAFDAERLRRGLRFVGAVPETSLATVVEALSTKATASHDGWVFAKILVAEEPSDAIAVGVSLKDALGFIEGRLRGHADRKAADRLFFSDELMQFLAWRARQAELAHG